MAKRQEKCCSPRQNGLLKIDSSLEKTSSRLVWSIGTGKFNAGGGGGGGAMDSVLSRGGGRVETGYRNWDNLRPDGSLGSYADVPVLLPSVCLSKL